MEVSTTAPVITGALPRVAVVTTSINPAPLSYKAWAEVGDLIVAGDVNSPSTLREYVDSLGGMYLSAEAQDEWTPGGQYIGWKNIQRRNAATWYALIGGKDARPYDYIVTVDDDNFPQGDPQRWIHDHIQNLHTRPINAIDSTSRFLNTGALCHPQFHQRGTPYGVNTEPVVRTGFFASGDGPKVVVSQSQVLGSPDCDAVERIVYDPVVVGITHEAVVRPGTYAAFNTQATVWRAEYAPLLAVLPGIGRYDDIFGSFIFHRLGRTYDLALFVGNPCVRQDRNPHNLQADLRAELFGMNRVFDFCRALDEAHISADMPLVESYGELITAVAHLLPSDAVKFAQAWIRAWRGLL